MTPPEPTYRPPWWLRGRHAQTLWGPLLRRPPRIPLRRERRETPDGDFVDLDWLDASGRPLVIILHGLEGNSRSHYVLGLLEEIGALGWGAVVLNFRSCGGEVNRLPRLYHSGETSDLDWLVRDLVAREPVTPLTLAGVSLGGNVILKWLGELGDRAPSQVRAAVAISTPFDLAACAAVLDRGVARSLYTAHFLRTMKAKVRAKAGQLASRVDLRATLRARTFAEYDRALTAPLHGFQDERDYWARSSSRSFLTRIRRPCLLVNAENDPFIPPYSLPRAEVASSPWLRAEFVREGGHAGFIEGPGGRRSWAERRAISFLRDVTEG